MAGRISYYGGIVTNGLVLDLDAGKKDSYPSSGNVWTDISGNNLVASFAFINNVSYQDGYFIAKNTGGYMNSVPGISGSLFPQSSGSVSIWINMPQYNQSSNLPVFDNYSNTRNHFFIRHGTSQQLQIAAQDNVNLTAYQGIITENTLQTNQWYNIIFTYVTGTPSSFNYYLNGTLKGTTTFASSSWTPSQQFVGYGNNVVSEGIAIATGSYGPLMIYNRNLSASEVLQNYNALKGRYGL